MITYQDKEFTVVASDFDGTILQHKMLTPSEELMEQVKELHRRGIHFIAASGRQYYNLQKLMAPVKDQISFICENGALIMEHDEPLFINAFPRELALCLIADLETLDSREIMVSTKEVTYIYDDLPKFYYLLHDVVGNAVGCVKNFADIEADMIKISIHWHDGIPANTHELLAKKYGDQMQVVDGGNGWLDFTMNGSDKGTALRRLAQIKGFSTANVLSFGDSENDMSMLTESGYSIAMETAKPHVAACAQEISPNVETILAKILQS